MTDARKKILVFIDWYLPGFRGGGPITSIANLVEALGDRYHFSIVTSDRDYGQREPYAGIATDTWIEQGPNCRVWYTQRETSSYRHVRHLITETDYDLLYLNSMFSLRYTIFPLWNSRAAKPECPVLLAPRGMLHAGALALKPLKKKLFLQALRWTGIHKQIRFQATDAQEAEDLRRVFGPATQVVEAPNLPRIVQLPFQSLPKAAGQLKLIFLSRLTEKKGLHLILEQLQGHVGDIALEIIGPDEEQGYWERCQKLVDALPANVRVTKLPPIPHDAAVAHIVAAHAFVMPTMGENFGHAIFEALSAGRPVVISDQTPWRDLAAEKVGFDIPLTQPAAYSDALRKLEEMEQAEWEQWARASWAYAQRYKDSHHLLEQNVAMFEAVMDVTTNK